MRTAPTLRILCVDDDTCVREIAAEALRDAGFEVVEAASGDEAKQLLSTPDTIDLLFTDVRMPGRLDGIDLARHIRRSRPDLPVLVASGYAEHMTSRLSAFDPPTRFLSKPYSLCRLVATINQMAQ